MYCQRIMLLLTAVVFLFGSPSVSAQESDEGLDRSSRARAAMRAHEERLHENKLVYVRACINSSTRLLRDLETALRAEMRNEDLVAATAIQERIDLHSQMRDDYREALAELEGGATDSPDRTRTARIQLYLWNSFQSDRGVSECDIQLKLDGEVVHELEEIEVAHEGNESARTIVNLPNIEFDELVIQVTEWRGHSAGFSEIALVQRRSNITDRYQVSVDADRGNKYYDPEDMVDEDLDTEWFPNDGVRCEVTLTLRDEDPDAVESPDDFEDEEEDMLDDGEDRDDEDGFFGLPIE